MEVKRLKSGMLYFFLEEDIYKEFLFRMRLFDMCLSVKENEKPYKKLVYPMRLHKSVGPPKLGESVHDVYFFTMRGVPKALEIKGVGGKRDFEAILQDREKFEINFSRNMRKLR